MSKIGLTKEQLRQFQEIRLEMLVEVDGISKNVEYNIITGK